MKHLLLAISSELISYLSLGVAFLSLFISFLKFRRSISDDLKKKQVDLVFDLISKLQKTHITLFFIVEDEEGAAAVDFSLNIYQIISNKKAKAHSRLFIPMGKWENLALDEFSHPMLPDIIAKRWREFLGELVIRTKADFDDPPFIYACLYEKISLRRPILTCYEYVGGTAHFYKSSKAVKKSIVKWLKNNNITDINQEALRKITPTRTMNV